MSTRPALTSAVDLSGGYADGTLSPVEVLEDVLAVVDEREPQVNALYLRDDPDRLRREAHESQDRWARGEQRGPLDGVPVTIKENVARSGVPMPSGNAGVTPVVPDVDSPVARRIGEAGMLVVGSTVMPDWGMLSSGVSSLHGITRSPLDPRLTTGGSSSGAGAAAAAGYGPLHVGTDIGGSIRLPGTWLGLATLKPSAGRVPVHAPYLGRAAGPMARSAADCALFMSVLAGQARSWADFDRLAPEAQGRVLPYIADWVRRGAGLDGQTVMDAYHSFSTLQARTVAAWAAAGDPDFVISPVAPVAAFPAEQPMPFPDLDHGMWHINFTVPWNMTGQPAGTVDAGRTADGRTIGVQVVGRPFDDAGVLRLMRQLERF